MTPNERLNFAMNLGFLLGSGRVKDAEALVDQVAHGTHPNTDRALERMNADVAGDEQGEWDKANAQDPYDGGRL